MRRKFSENVPLSLLAAVSQFWASQILQKAMAGCVAGLVLRPFAGATRP